MGGYINYKNDLKCKTFYYILVKKVHNIKNSKSYNYSWNIYFNSNKFDYLSNKYSDLPKNISIIKSNYKLIIDNKRDIKEITIN